MITFPLAIMMITDESDREFMKDLYIKYHMMMYRMAQSLSKSKEDAEDIVSDAVVSLICKISDIRNFDCSVLEGYVIAVVKNVAFMRWRKKHRHNEVELDDEIMATYPGNDAPLDEGLLREFSIQQLMAAISTLKEGDQMIIGMRYFQKMSNCEIAKALNISESTVRAKLTRIRQKLCEILSEADSNE